MDRRCAGDGGGRFDHDTAQPNVLGNRLQVHRYVDDGARNGARVAAPKRAAECRDVHRIDATANLQSIRLNLTSLRAIEHRDSMSTVDARKVKSTFIRTAT